MDIEYELKKQLKKSIESDLIPFLKQCDFESEFSTTKFGHDVYKFVKGDIYIDFDYMGFHFHDYPWQANPMLGKTGFKKSTNAFDSVSLTYWKEKIAPKDKWGREFLQLTFDNYPINSIEQIKKAIEQTIFDLDNFCGDFLRRNDFAVFEKLRQIQYIESLVRFNVYGTYYQNGSKEILIKREPEIE